MENVRVTGRLRHFYRRFVRGMDTDGAIAIDGDVEKDGGYTPPVNMWRSVGGRVGICELRATPHLAVKCVAPARAEYRVLHPRSHCPEHTENGFVAIVGCAGVGWDVPAVALE
jgi:hypothetical protein